jgi:hypothetical protein
MTPMVGIAAPHSSRQRGNQQLWGGHQLLYYAPGNQEMMTKTMAEATSHRMTGELSSCLQCHHFWHSSTTPHYAMTWPQDHDDSHARTYSTKWHSLQAKLDRHFLRLMTLRSGEPIAFIHDGFRDIFFCKTPLYCLNMQLV